MVHFGHERGSGREAAPLWQRAWLNAYPSDVPSSIAYPNIPLGTLLENAAARFPGRRACTLYGRALTYAQLTERGRRFAASLADLGAKPGRRVAMLLPNIPEYLIALQATWLTGATALQLSPLMVGEELRKWIEMTDCHLLVTLDLLAPTVLDSIDLERGPLEHVIVASLAERMPAWKSWLYRVERLRRHGPLRLREEGRVHPFDNLVRSAPQRQLAPNLVPEEDVAVLAPTGGTTASPKAVMLTHRNLVANALQLKAWSRGEDGVESALAVLPFFHAYGLTVGMLASLASASTIHLYPRFEAKPVLELLARERIEIVPAVPAMIAALNRELQKQPRDLSFIRAVISGASAFDPAVRAAFSKHGARNIVEGYGLSEASPVTHANPLGDGNRPGTIGLPLPDTEARIMDQAAGLEELPVGAVGELVIRGPQVMKGYYNNPEETARTLRNGWLYTGDIARCDRDGYFTIVDRKKDIIKTSGFLVFPAEVEEVLRLYPGVAEAAVIGVPDAERGEVVKALVVPSQGSKLDVTALDQHCQQHLGKQKRPKQIEIVTELPKNFLGKVQRRRLRESPHGKNAADGNGHPPPS
jgi:long-chain acyl-CoA synthetase